MSQSKSVLIKYIKINESLIIRKKKVEMSISLRLNENKNSSEKLGLF